MNIYIYNCSNTFNYGSMMMGENFISYFNKVTGAVNNYYVETEDEINIIRLKNATGINEIYPVTIDSLFNKGQDKFDYLLSQMKFKKVLSDFARKIDLAVVLGGDDFTEDYGWKDPLLSIIRFNLLRREDIKVVMLGQTMGPYRSFRKPAMKILLSKINKIYPRDSLTYNYLMGLGLKNISLTDDLALLPLTKQEIKERSREYITYCPSELIYRYTKDGNRKNWVVFNRFLLETILDRYPEKKLVLLAHVLRPEHADDRIMVGELYDLLSTRYKEQILAERGEMYPYEVRNYIQQSVFVVSGRMHPVISSIQCGIPAIALSYSSKYWGIIGERYGLGGYIIDVRYLNYKEMKGRFIYLINKIEDEYEQIEEKIKKNNTMAKKNILSALEEIRDLK